MKVRLQGAGEVTLGRADFVASGGEGSVYARDDVAYKIYTDPGAALAEGKLRELAAISDPRVVRPERMLLDPASGEPVGYSMRHVAGAYTLCQLIPPAFQARHGLGPGDVARLVERMRGAVEAVHRAEALIVDLNEMNVLVERQLADVAFIDTDSYRTRSYPATALLPSVRDWRAPDDRLDELTDWFSFAVVTFQLFIGIHPYKGRHPRVTGLEQRMRTAISVFDPAVSVPKICQPMDVIPAPLRDWYEAVLQHGQRCAPPGGGGGAPVVSRRVEVVAATPGGAVRFTEVETHDEPVLGLWERQGVRVIRTATGMHVDGRTVPMVLDGEVAVGFTRRGNRPILATAGERLTLTDVIDAAPIPVAMRADEVMCSAGRLYVRSGTRVVELEFHEGPAGPLALAGKTVATVLEHAARLHPGCVVQSLLGACYVSLFPSRGAGFQVHLPELDGETVVEARFDGGVAMVVSARDGEYHRRVFRFDDAYRRYDVREVADIAPGALNFVTLESGVCVCLDEEDDLEVFSRRPDDGKLKRVRDASLGGHMRLVQAGGRVAFVHGARVVEMTLSPENPSPR